MARSNRVYCAACQPNRILYAMKRIVVLLAAMCLPIICAFSQQSLPVITLQQSIDAALAKGDSYRILAGNLAVARAQHAENVSKNSLALSGSLGAGYNYSLYTNTTD